LALSTGGGLSVLPLLIAWEWAGSYSGRMS
jgi:hypothetical protein